MLLAKLNIQELVTNKINDYLTDSDLDFSDLKNHLLNKAPIPQVHTQIAFFITNAQDLDKAEVKKILETRAYNDQLAEDDRQKKHDQTEGLKDEELKARFTRELNHIPTEIESYETECAELRGKLDRLMQSEQSLSNTPTSSTKKLSSASQQANTAAIERLNNTILSYEIKIQNLHHQKHTTQVKLKDIESRAEIRIQLQLKRYTREQARRAYKTSGTGVYETLTSKHRALLLNNIKNQHDELENKCAEYISQSEQINFAFFLEQLPQHLKKMKLAPHDVLALQNILKFIKHHFEYEKQSASTQDSLNKKRALITSQLEKLQKLNAQLDSLHAENPHLATQNKQLTAKNEELTSSQAKNSNFSQRLGTPALLLFAITLIGTIPLILTLSGVIPFFIGPTLLYFLFTAPPAVLLIATITLAITAFVYDFKANADETLIKRHQHTITENKNQMEKNLKSTHTLQTLTIPNLEAQIKKDEIARDTLVNSLKQSQRLSQQAFNQAKEIEPVLQSQSPILNRDKPDVISDEPKSEDSQSSDDEAELEEGLKLAPVK